MFKVVKHEDILTSRSVVLALGFPAISLIGVDDRTGDGMMTLKFASMLLYLVDWPTIRASEVGP